MSDRRRFFAPVSDTDVRECLRCGERKQLVEFARDATRRTGRKSICASCDREKSKRYYHEHREAVRARAAAKRPAPAPKFCGECGVLLEGRRRVVCSSRCGEQRFKRLNPEGYAARERAKVARRRERRREGGS